MSFRLSVRYKTALYRNTGRIGLPSARMLPSTCPTLCFKEIVYLLKIKVHPSRTLSQTLDLKISPCQVDRVVNKTRRRSILMMTPVRQSTSRGWLRLNSTTWARPDPRGLFRETRAADPDLRQSQRTLSGRVRLGPCSGI